MEALKKTVDQFLALLKTMSASQQMMLGAVTLLVVGAFGFLMWNGTSQTNYTPLSVGKVFSVQEIIHAEEALLQAGLTDFKRNGQRLTVPINEVEKYNSALIASGTMPQNWAEEWEKQFSGLGPFANNKQMAERKEIARAKLASQMVSSLPQIESANVVWDQEKGQRWPARARSTATVFVRSKPGQEINSTLVHSIQVSIAGMKADLKSNDVTVFDLVRGLAFQAESADDPFGSSMLNRVHNLKEMYRSEILRAVDYIDFVRVAVNVDIEKVKSAIRKQQTIEAKGGFTLLNKENKSSRVSNQSPTKNEPGQGANAGLDLQASPGVQRSETIEDSDGTQITLPSFQVTQEALIGAMPENVQVSITIPQDYYRAVALQSGTINKDTAPEEVAKEIEKIKKEVTASVQASISKIIPIKDPANPLSSIEVGTYVRIPPEVVEATTSLFDSTGWFFSQWGSAIGLVLFALWAMMTLSKNAKQSLEATPPVPEMLTPKMQTEKATEEAVAEQQQQEEAQLDPLFDLPRPDTRNRDTLQHLVRDNPEMTASILHKWVTDSV